MARITRSPNMVIYVTLGSLELKQALSKAAPAVRWRSIYERAVNLLRHMEVARGSGTIVRLRVFGQIVHAD